MRLVLVSAALTLVGGTAVGAQPVGFDHRGQQQSDRGASPSLDAARSRHWVRGQTFPAGDGASDNHGDYKSKPLRRPHTGRRWVKMDNDNFTEVSATTGVIYQMIGGR